jgi:hypothetical protein
MYASLTYDLRQQVFEHAKGDKPSKVFQKALEFYFQHHDQVEMISRETLEAVEFLSAHKDVFIDHAVSTSESIRLLSSRVDQIASTIQGIFAVPFDWDLTPPTPEEFDVEKRKATAAYAADPQILRSVQPHVLKQIAEVKQAALQLSFQKRREHIDTLLKDMPFMEDDRFYLGFSMGPAIFDKKYPRVLLHEHDTTTGPFEVLYINADAETPLLTYPKTRPYFRISFPDPRDHVMVSGIDKVMAMVPAIVADYLAFRRQEETERKAAQ